MDYEALVFDMDGVLLPGRETPGEIYRRATAAMLADFDTEVADQRRWTRLERPGAADRFRRVCDEVGLPPAAAWGYREHASTAFENDHIDAGNREPFDDTSVIESLAADAAIGVVSNNRHGTVRHCVDRFPWGNHVDTYRGRFPSLPDFDRMKPDPAFLDWALERLDTRNVLFVGDRRSDVTTAHRAGCDAALLAREDEPPAGDPSPQFVISSLEELQV